MLLETLRAGELVLLDGATGTELQKRGAAMDPTGWCGPATLNHDHLLTAIHFDYLAAGAEIVTANTFATSRLRLGPVGLGDRVAEVNRRAVAAALKARDQFGANTTSLVAGSLSHHTYQGLSGTLPG